MPKIIMLAGAPPALAWPEQDLTVTDLLPAFARIVDDERDDKRRDEELNKSSQSNAPTTSMKPAWRSLPPKPTHLPTGLSQRDWDAQPASRSHPPASTTDPALSFLTTTDGSSEAEFELSQYLEKSFALHEEAQSSQLAPASETPALRRHCTPAASFTTPHASSSSTGSVSPFNSPTVDCSPTSARPAPVTLPNLTDLGKLPSAATLASLEPQTVTVDLVVGVISVSAPRTVTIRRTGREIELVEMLVGDETKAGFGVTFWLPQRAGKAKGAVPDLRDAVMAVRSGQVVVMRHVALSRYKGVVHGQTLARRGQAASATSVARVEDVVGVGRVAGTGYGSAVLQKVERVRGWTRDFVRPAHAMVVVGRPDDARGKKRKVAELREAGLPPNDTQ